MTSAAGVVARALVLAALPTALPTALPASLPSALPWALLVLAAVVLLLVGGIAARRAARRRRAERVRRATEPLRPLLLELVAGEPDEQADAASRLTALAPPVWRSVEPAVVALLSKVRGDSRAEVVGLLEDRGVLARARADLHRRGAVERARAAELVGAAGDATSVPALVELLTADRAGEVRLVAARALGRIGAAEAAAPLLSALREPRGRGGVPPQVLAHALLRLGPAAAGHLTAALVDDSAAVRATACEILGRVGAVGSVAALRERLRGDASPEVRARAATALGRLGMPSALPDLVAASAPPAPGAVRTCAVRALGELGDPRAVPVLAGLLADDDGRVAALAGPALVGLGGPGRTALHEAADPGAPEAAAAPDDAVDAVPDAAAADAPEDAAPGGPLVRARAREALVMAQLREVVPAQRRPSRARAVAPARLVGDGA
ncbi:HEAT repeat domain-containing protein [uncultured Pseudokineococcus sp.]|uniref:HEAT repeat domain-containing protein n=1 Tax=uncultured Pseudokineococcus sp. TaxID=1642928 RepID=UPI002633B4D5|nr:HEAT repeat domain-containing protein [uncultured Pseudokineococcus sp.]